MFNWFNAKNTRSVKLFKSSSVREEKEYLHVLFKILQAQGENYNNPQDIYPILLRHQDKLDARFALILQKWSKNAFFSANWKKVSNLAILINAFSRCIHNFPLGNRGNNLEIAIGGYRSVLQVYTYEKFPKYWVEIQNNLGNAYLERVYGERSENIENAIASYQAALKLKDRKAFSTLNWVELQNNLGNAYLERIAGDRAENIENAIVSYQAALDANIRRTLPMYWAKIQNNLANVYNKRICGERANNIEMAIAGYKTALEAYKCQGLSRYSWLETQIELGDAYCNRIAGDRSENIEQAIAAYRAALEVYKPQKFPSQWQEIQNNLASIVDKIHLI